MIHGKWLLAAIQTISYNVMAIDREILALEYLAVFFFWTVNSSNVFAWSFCSFFGQMFSYDVFSVNVETACCETHMIKFQCKSNIS